MAIRVFLVLSLLALLACADKSNNADNAVAGWRSAGLSLPDAENTGGVHELAAVGDVLFALDCYTTPRDSNGIRHREWRLWSSKVGSDDWSILPFVHDSCSPEEIHVFQGSLYASSICKTSVDTTLVKYEGLWQYSIVDKKWNQALKLGQGLMPKNGTSLGIGAIGDYKGALVVFVGNGQKEYVCWMGGGDSKQEKIIPCPGNAKNIFRMEIRELNGALYGISEPYGVFRYTEGAAAWDSLPSARGRKETMTVDICKDAAGLLGVNSNVNCSQEVPAGLDEGVASITVHDSHIIVGYKFNALNDRGLFRLNDDDTWTSLTPNYMYQDTVTISDAMETTEALLSYKGWLIAGGYFSSEPRFWVPLDSATPKFGDWRIVYDNWGDVVGDSTTVVKTTDLLGVGDTLYAAAWTTVIKIPLNEVSSLWKYKYKSEIYPHLQDSLSKVKAAP